MKCLSLIALFFVAVSLQAQAAPDPGGALAALAVVPANLRDGIVRVSADNAAPNPPQWYILARKSSGELVSLTIANGQIVEQKPSLNLRAIVTDPSPIDRSRLQVDSDAAWRIAAKHLTTKGLTLGSASFVLRQKGRAATPIWEVWCYGPDGGSLAYLEILGSTGAIVSSD